MIKKTATNLNISHGSSSGTFITALSFKHLPSFNDQDMFHFRRCFAITDDCLQTIRFVGIILMYRELRKKN